MKRKNSIKALLLLVAVIFLYSFANNRNSRRKAEKVNVEFTNGTNLFISEATVNKLLIQKREQLTNERKDSLVLSRLENFLNQNQMIAEADVYQTVNGMLGTTITQRTPIGRVFSENGYYLDADGEKMALSENYTARVPLLVGISEKNYQEVIPLLEKIAASEFFKQLVVSIHQLPDGEYKLRLRALDFDILFGKIKKVDAKFNNFKAFYKKAKTSKKLETYKLVNLKYAHQVVCTKKENYDA